MAKDWLTEEIDFYDFIWRSGTELCGSHVNAELMEDFAKGGDMFERMKAKILEKYPTRESALEAARKGT